MLLVTGWRKRAVKLLHRSSATLCGEMQCILTQMQITAIMHTRQVHRVAAQLFEQYSLTTAEAAVRKLVDFDWGMLFIGAGHSAFADTLTRGRSLFTINGVSAKLDASA